LLRVNIESNRGGTQHGLSPFGEVPG
jgi:hypothetical protein